MKKYAISNEIPEEGLMYLTPGKKYEIIKDMPSMKSFTICSDTDDDNDGCFCSYEGCAHLNGGDWTIINEEE